ncbi:MAG: hypothetical protein NVSMB65_21110 [Chloroflexota bacterium]
MTHPAQDQDRWPVDPATGSPLPPRAQPGYYPGFTTLSQQAYWDDATRTVVLDRVHNVPPLRFFTAEEAALLQAVYARVLPQDDRDEEHRIPLVNSVDARLASGRINGYRFEGMPPDGAAHREGLRAIAALAQHLHGRPFEDLDPREQDEILKMLHDDKVPEAEGIWRHMSVTNYWSLLVQDAIEAYYAHPYAWDEIGFGGPAYPRGYMRQERGEPEPWEVHEQRYAWAPPPTSLSGEDTPLGGAHPHTSQPAVGQEGTH